MKKKIGIAVIIIFTLVIFIKAELDFNPSVRVLASVINFSESTLKSPDYLAYNIDLKDLFRNYTNSDISYSGSAYIKKIKGFPYSISGSIKGQRSSEQEKFSCKADLDVLVLNIGKMDFYADKSTVYLVAPMLGDISYGFDTGDNLFPQAPNLNNDINREWFHNNKKNIYNFVRSIEITKTDNVYVDEDGTEAREFDIVIPQGEGDFIWDLLGMEAPDHDMKCSLFLDKLNHTRKIVFDLSYKTKGAYISVYGKNLGTLELYSPLPDDEEITATIKRDGESSYTNAYQDNLTYKTNAGDVFTIDCGVFLNYVDSGIKTELTNIKVAKNSTILAEGYIKGSIKAEENMGDVFENAGADLSDVNVIDWDTIKNDTASFIDDVINKARENVDVFDIFD
ncbi:hypothetical protein SAMN04487830_12046 [Pseudobutyrivibrio sp. OR37]|uniref:hypothetical protein n=1 Tax=Pseudobutyrivibrio sp. OR37 TaxID=1798186 RepID=UPI0008E25590|nr:hypothetical protein [Pseudobutyrivibrio sp. OR37]SFI06485.1 hypothetical protein SAMN04487830_12046 [Pseudobutyrivibrio sp. OR37]